jgi:very-short-patch-repair endonuclease
LDRLGTTADRQARVRGASPFEEAVQAALADALKDYDVEVVARVGVGEQPVDLAVRDRDGRFLLAIETDGQTFADQPPARDRDRLRQEVLERLGWQVHRIWSTAWIAAQDEEQQRVVTAVERARRIQAGVLVDETPLAVLKPEDRPSQGGSRPHRQSAGAAPNAGAPKRDADTPLATGPGTIRPDAGARDTTESPAGLIERGEAPGGADTTEVCTGTAAAPRPIDKVPADEIAAAARAVLTRAFAMSRDDLVVAVARELGYQRTGGRIKIAVGRVADGMLHDGELVESGGHVRLTSQDD